MIRLVLSVLALLIATAAVAGPVPEAVSHHGAQTGGRALVIRGTTDIAIFSPALDLFAKTRPGLAITYEQWGSNALYLTAAEACAAGAGEADLLVSSSVDQLVKLVNDGCARPHRSALTDALSPDHNWRNEIFGVSQEPAVMIYNRRFVPPGDAPETRFDLIDMLRPGNSPYAGRVATYDIEASGLGYLFAFMDSRQATTFGSLIEAFGRSGAIATCCSAEIIDGVARGDYAIAYNVLGSYALARAENNPDLVVVAPRDYTLVLSRAAMIPKGARDPETAAAFIDFLLSDAGRRVLAQQRLILSNTSISALDPGEGDLALRSIPLSPVLLAGLDRARRARFLDLWRATFQAK